MNVPDLTGVSILPTELLYEHWMEPLTYILLVFDIASAVLLGWIYVDGLENVLSRLAWIRRDGGHAEESAERRRMQRWQREQWARMDAEREDLELRWMLTVEERAAWERYRAVQAEMRRYGVV